jgi:hypothetical protein
MHTYHTHTNTHCFIARTNLRIHMQCPAGLVDPCSCTFSDHVECSGGRINSLNFYKQGLAGPLSALVTSLVELTGMVHINLGYNQLTGRIPREIGSLSSLIELGLDGNQLTGPAPPELANLRSLVSLGLNGNQLTGTLPAFDFVHITYCCSVGSVNHYTCPLPPNASSCAGGPGCPNQPPPTCQ